jgi:hypothetical protein
VRGPHTLKISHSGHQNRQGYAAQLSGWKARATEKATLPTARELLAVPVKFEHEHEHEHEHEKRPPKKSPLVLVLSPPWRTVLVLVLEKRSPPTDPSRLRGFA